MLTITVGLVLEDRAQMREAIQPIKVQPRKKLRAKTPPALSFLRAKAMMVGRKYGIMQQKRRIVPSAPGNQGKKK